MTEEGATNSIAIHLSGSSPRFSGRQPGFGDRVRAPQTVHL